MRYWPIVEWATNGSEKVEENARPDRASEVEHLYSVAPIGLCYFDADLRYVYVNEWLARINGLPVEAHVGEKIDNVLKEVAAGVVPKLAYVLETGEPIIEGTVEAETPAHPGEKRHYMHNYYPDKSQDGTVAGVSCVVQDITERVELERETVAAIDHERDRIGHELHDDLGQLLIVISWGLNLLSEELEREQSPHTKAAQDLARRIQESIVKTQRIALALSPEFSSKLGFKGALKALVETVNTLPNVTCQAQFSDEDDFPDNPDAVMNLYRIAQEAINNALKHSGAQNINLRCGRDGDSIILEVLDDGTGIPSKKNRVDSAGLRSMYYRARILRGRLEIGHRTEGGTRVLLSCPAR